MGSPIRGGNLLNPKECAYIIARYGRDLVPSRVGNAGDQSLRESQQRGFEDDDLVRQLASQMFGYAQEHKITLSGPVEQMCIIRYQPGGQYEWHMDNEMTGDGLSRKVALVLSLNDDFTGGGTEFMWPHPGSSFTVKLPAGSGIMFPSFLMHRGLPVLTGERWILVSWAMGPQWT